MFRAFKAEWPLILLVAMLLGTSGYWFFHHFSGMAPYPVSWISRFGNGAFIGYIVALVLTAIPPGLCRATVRWLCIAAASALFVAEGCAFGIWGLHISPALLTLAAETNMQETRLTASLLASSRYFWEVLAALAILLGLYIAVNGRTAIINRRIASFGWRKSARTVAWIFICAITAWGIRSAIVISGIYRSDTSACLERWVVRNDELQEYTDNCSRLLFALQSVNLMKNGKRDWEELQHSFLTQGDAVTSASDSLQVVCIIGESFIRSHSSIYGYPLETNPRLCREAMRGNLVAFADMAAFAKHTSLSLRSILSVNPSGDGNRWNSAISFPSIFRRAGFRVELNDNQLTYASSIWAFSLSAVMLSKTMTQHCYNSLYVPQKHTDDLSFVDSVAARHPVAPHKQLTLYHLKGQHLWPSYPDTPEWNVFSPADIPNPGRPWLDSKRRQQIAGYDNATLFNDSVVSHIISRYRHTEAIVVYLSDHGEEIYDYRDAALRQPPAPGMMQEFLAHQFAIPFFIWMSDLYMQRHPAHANLIRRAALRPGSLADIANTFIGLGGISTPCYNPQRDILSPEFIPAPRLTNLGDTLPQMPMPPVAGPAPHNLHGSHETPNFVMANNGNNTPP